jgi:FMN phosphatase YigB (HAD superfamily)
VLFDLEDTLVPTTRIDTAAIAHASGLAALRLGLGAEAVGAIDDAFRAELAAEPFPPPGSAVGVYEWRVGLWARALEQAGGDAALAADAHDAWSAARLSAFRFADDVAALVTRVQAAGYATAIVTNGHADIQRAKLAACDAAALFAQRIIVSGEQPEWKPMPSIFETALSLVGARADEAIMVGDGLATDVQGGLNAGLLATVWVRGEGAHALPERPAGSPAPTHTIASVLELEAVLAQLELASH